MRGVRTFALEGAGFFLTVLVVAQIYDHGFDFPAWRLTAHLVVVWLIWAIVMAAFVTLRSRRRIGRQL